MVMNMIMEIDEKGRQMKVEQINNPRHRKSTTFLSHPEILALKQE